ncbi:MAG: hypothetical protein ACI9R3_001736, partial [Verrucomicrobiales bacterium]
MCNVMLALRELKRSGALRKFSRRFLFWSSAVALLLIVAYLVEDYRGKSAWEKFRTRWEAEGEVFDLPDRSAIEVPDEENFAKIPLFEEFFRLKMDYSNGYEFNHWPWSERLPPDGSVDASKGRLYGLVGSIDAVHFRAVPVAAWKNRDLPRDWRGAARVPLYRAELRRLAGAKPRLSEAEAAVAILDVVDRYWAHDWEQIRDESRREFFVSKEPLDSVRREFNVVINYLRMLASHSQMRFSAFAKEGDFEAALAQWQLMLRLTDYCSMGSEYSSAGHRIVVGSFQSIWECAQRHSWSEGQLMKIQSLLHDQSGRMEAELLESIRLRRNLNLDMILDADRRQQRFPPNNRFTASLRHLVPEGWIFQNALSIARPLQKYVLTDSSEGIEWKVLRFDQLEEWQKEIDQHEYYFGDPIHHSVHPYHRLASAIYPMGPLDIRSSLKQKAICDVVIAGLACERYFLANG